MDFIRRYEELSGHFNSERTPSDERLVYVERDEVMSIIRDSGYFPLFNAREKFYKIKSVYSRRLIDVNYRIRKPVFGTYEDLDDILKTAFGMYEDFKLAFM